MTVNYSIRRLQKKDNRKNFDCDDEELNLFFHRYAGQNQFRHYIGVTYVCVVENEIIAYATVSPMELDADRLPGKKFPPYPIPVLRVARLAVSTDLQKAGIGKKMLRFCLELAEKMRDELGCVGVVVDAKKHAVGYYEQFGFVPIDFLEGGSPQIPKQTAMFLALSSLPRPKK